MAFQPIQCVPAPRLAKEVLQLSFWCLIESPVLQVAREAMEVDDLATALWCMHWLSGWKRLVVLSNEYYVLKVKLGDRMKRK